MGKELENQQFIYKGNDLGAVYTTYNTTFKVWAPTAEKITLVVYKDFNDLLSKIRYLLLNPKEADEIRKKGMLRSQREHTWEKRFEAIFKCFRLI